MASLLSKVLAQIRSLDVGPWERGRYFELLARYYIEHDPVMRQQFEKPQLYADWAKAQGKKASDTGIDIVAKERAEDGWCAVQCKFHKDKVDKGDIDSFFTASGKKEFSRRLIIDTANEWTANAEDALEGQDKPVNRISLPILEDSPVNWLKVLQPDQPVLRASPKEMRPHQKEAVKEVCKGLAKADRGKLIMACGTGKSLTSLRISEKLAGLGNAVLFLVPSLSLMSQIIRAWAQDKKKEQRCFAVCSDREVGNEDGKQYDAVETKVHDLEYPATTKADKLANDVAKRKSSDAMTVVFATYQSLQVISDAQSKHGLGDFSLIVCDEAHRTTGATRERKEESNFVKIHDSNYVRGEKRLYMTATPRVFGDAARSRAREENIILYTMDNEKMFGATLFERGFGWAVEEGLLSDYKVVVLGIDEEMVSVSLQNRLADGDTELKLDDATKIIGCYRALTKRGLKNKFDGRPPLPCGVP